MMFPHLGSQKTYCTCSPHTTHKKGLTLPLSKIYLENSFHNIQNDNTTEI